MTGGRSLSVVFPAWNEERRLPALLSRLEEVHDAARSAGLSMAEIVVVDDGSSDGTADLLRAATGIATLSLPQNLGKGGAVRAGILAASADLVLVSDVDLSTPAGDLARLVEHLDRGFDIAIGSRALPRSRVLVHQPFYREWMGKTFNAMIRALTRLPFHDTQCGFKLFRAGAARVLFQPLRTLGFAYDVEILVAARRAGLRVVEVPVSWRNEPQTTVSIVRSSARMAWDLAWIALRSRSRAAGVQRMLGDFEQTGLHDGKPSVPDS